MFDRELGEQVQQIFLEDIGACERVDHEKWARRGVWARMQEFVAWFLEEQA